VSTRQHHPGPLAASNACWQPGAPTVAGPQAGKAEFRHSVSLYAINLMLLQVGSEPCIFSILQLSARANVSCGSLSDQSEAASLPGYRSGPPIKPDVWEPSSYKPGQSRQMIEYARHVPLRSRPWGESDVSAAFNDIVANGLEQFDCERLWPGHLLEAPEEFPTNLTFGSNTGSASVI
jgi:hypothetical protein